MIAGTLELQLMADIARLRRDMDDAKTVVGQTVGAISKQLEGLRSLWTNVFAGVSAAAAVVGLKNAVLGALEATAAMRGLATQAGMTVEALSGLSVVGRATGTAAEQIAGASNKLSKALATSNEESRGAATAIKALGLNFDEIQRMAPDQRMLAIAQAMAQFKDGSDKSAAAMLLFGKTGAELLPFLKDLAERGIAAAKVTTQQAEEAHRFEVQLGLLKAASEAWKKQLALELLPTLNAIVSELSNARGAATDFNSVLSGSLKTTLETISVLGANVAFVFGRMGNDIGAVLAALEAVRTGNLRGALDVLKGMADSDRAARGEVDKLSDSILNANKAQEESNAQLAKENFMRSEHLQTMGKLSVQNDKTVDEYRKIVKSVQERIDVGNKELQAGRELTDTERFEQKVLTDMGLLKKDLSAEQQKAINDKLAEKAAIDLKVKVQESELDLAKQISAQRQADKNSDYTQSTEGTNAITNAWAQQLKTVNDSIKAKQDEAQAERLVVQLNISHGEAIEMVTIARLRDEQTRTVLDGEAYRALQQQIDGHEKLLGLLADDSAWKRQLELMGQLQDLGHQVWDDLFSGGHDTFKRLGDDIKRFLIDELYELVAKKWIFNIAASITGSVASGAASAAASGVGSSIGGIGTSAASNSLFSGVGSAIAGGYSGAGAAGFAASGGSFASTVGAGLATDAMGATVAEGTAAATIGTGATGAVSAGLAAIPVVGWIALAGLAAYSIFGGKGGGPKTESGFGPVSPGRGDPAGATAIAQSIQSGYTSIASVLGVQNTQLANLGVFYAQDPKGKAQTQLQIAAGSYNRASLYGGNFENVGRSDAEFQQAVALASAQLIVKNLQDAAGGKVGDFLRTIDVASASLDTLQKALQVAQDVGTFDRQLDALGASFQSLKDMSVDATETFIKSMGGLQNATAVLGSYVDNFYSDTEKRAATAKAIATQLNTAGLGVTQEQVLGMSRAQFRAITEAASANPNSGIYRALLNVNQAFASITPAAQDAATAIGAVAGAGKSLWEWSRNLGITRSGTASPQDQLAAARAAYIQDRSLAAGGNADAYARLQDSAGAYIDAAKLNYSSSSGFQAIFDQVRAEIAALPEVKSYNDQMLAATTDGAAQVTDAVNAQTSALQAQLADLIDQVKTLVAESQTQTQVQATTAQITQDGNDAIVSAVQTAAPFSPAASPTGLVTYDMGGG